MTVLLLFLNPLRLKGGLTLLSLEEISNTMILNGIGIISLELTLMQKVDALVFI